jgi:hypothetical protein
MLVTDPKQRATLQEIMTHPWLMKGYPSPPENYLPPREPLTLPLDPKVIEGMTGFEFGSAEMITSQLTKLIGSEDYQNAIRQAQREAPAASIYSEKKKSFGFDFYKRRSSASSKDTLTGPSAEVLPYTSTDPINAYNPLVSVYYLVREKLERDRANMGPESQPGIPVPASDVEKLTHMSVPRQPELAHTSETSYELKGEPAPISGRTRPRARTHGDDEVSEAVKNVNLGGASASQAPKVEQQQQQQQPVRKDLSVGGMFRRLSTRRHGSHHRGEKHDNGKSPMAPTLSVQPPDQPAANVPRKSLSIRRQKEPSRPPAHDNASQPGNPDLLTPPTTADGSRKPHQPLGRSTSVSEADWRKKYSRGKNPEAAGTDGSKQSIAEADKSFAHRAKSVSHGKRDAFRSRHARKEESNANLDDTQGDDSVDIATSAASGGDPSASATPAADFVRPVFLKGLFSVQTTSTKTPLDIRRDVIRVLEQLGVSFKEIKGGFVCVHRPSIDLKSVVEGGSTEAEATNMVSTSASHRRKLSQNMNNGAGSSKQASRRRADTSYTNSDASNDSVNDGVLGGSLILQFEIYIVKVPLLSLHGVQFKSVSKTNTWQYKSLASRILAELKL